MSPRAAATLAVVLGGLPAWLVLGGLVGSGALASTFAHSSALLPAGGVAALITVHSAGRLRVRRGWPEPIGGAMPWFSTVARMLHISGPYVRSRAGEANLPARAALAAVWGPWWALLGFWVLLWVHALVDIALHAASG